MVVVPDNDPLTVDLLELYDGFDRGSGEPSDDVYTAPRPDDDGYRAQAAVHGNGAQDGNRVASYYYGGDHCPRGRRK